MEHLVTVEYNGSEKNDSLIERAAKKYNGAFNDLGIRRGGGEYCEWVFTNRKKASKFASEIITKPGIDQVEVEEAE